jgi:NADH:ubiquinone oxidoreductase subunit C
VSEDPQEPRIPDPESVDQAASEPAGSPATRPVPTRPAGTPGGALPRGDSNVPSRPAGAVPTRAAAARPAGGAARPTPAPARPAAPPEPDPELVLGLREAMPELEWTRVHSYIELKIPKIRLLEIAQRLRDHWDYDYLSAITPVDWLDRIEMVYHLYSFNYRKRPEGVVLRVDLERPELPEYPLCPSLTRLWPGADFQEREIWDLMGVKFVGHPDLRRILNADDFPGHPLRKDFVFDYEYVLVKHLGYGIEGQLGRYDAGSRGPNWSQN